jgi:hypothetical protein
MGSEPVNGMEVVPFEQQIADARERYMTACSDALDAELERLVIPADRVAMLEDFTLFACFLGALKTAEVQTPPDALMDRKDPLRAWWKLGKAVDKEVAVQAARIRPRSRSRSTEGDRQCSKLKERRGFAAPVRSGQRRHQRRHNLQAIHHIIEARRTELRHGGLNIVKQTFKGFTALPAPDWKRALGLDQPGRTITKQDVEAAYRERAKTAHPDRGGSDAAMADLTAAKTMALAAFPQ